MRISLPQILQTLKHVEPADRLLQRAVPRLGSAQTRLDALEQLFKEGDVANYDDAVELRHWVLSDLKSGLRTLRATPELTSPGLGAPSKAVTSARAAASHAELAIAELNHAFLPSVEPLGGVHALVDWTRVHEARSLIERATGATSNAARHLVNGE